jgi:hypothetical protein
MFISVMDGKHDDEEEDERTLIIHGETTASKSFAAVRGVGELDLSLAERKTRGGVQEECVVVVFDLPDGSQGEATFKLGQTVEVLKSYIESEYGIPMQNQQLYLDDARLLDPLSLLDYPQAKGVEEILIRVQGPLSSEFKK